jgi:hypothetical protein
MQMQLDVEAPERRATPAQQVHLPMDSPYDLEQVAANYEGEQGVMLGYNLGVQRRYWRAQAMRAALTIMTSSSSHGHALGPS